MLKDIRFKQILDLLNQNGEVQINNLCRLFNVTETTIRRDLDELAEKKLLIRTHGGAILAEEDLLVEIPYEKRNRKNVDKKEAIARKALDFIESGMKILLDSGSTTFILSQVIPNSLRLAVLTNAINIAYELNSHSNLDIFVIGGDLRKNSLSCVGGFSVEMLQRFSVDIAFVGASGIGSEYEFYTLNSVQADIKRTMLSIAKKRILLMDSTKLNKSDYVCFAQAKDFDYVITDSEAPSDIVEGMRQKNIEVILV